MADIIAKYSAPAEMQPAVRRAAAPRRSMTRVHLSAEDLAQIRFCETPAPLVEAVLALAGLQQRFAPAQRKWLKRARHAFPATARPLFDLIPGTGYWPEFLDPVTVDLEEGLDIVCSTPRPVLREQLAASWQRPMPPPSWLRALADGDRAALETVRCALRDFYTACVAPHWQQITTEFCVDLARRQAVLATRGLAAIFADLHPDLAWLDGSLKRTGRPGEYWLAGGGLQLVPSVSWNGPPLFTFPPGQPDRSALMYSARISAADHHPGPEARDLSKLLGSTRSAVLHALNRPCGTTDLAAQLGISAASASEHVATLRMAGLAQTVRQGYGVRHSLTPLGRSLLDGR